MSEPVRDEKFLAEVDPTGFDGVTARIAEQMFVDAGFPSIGIAFSDLADWQRKPYLRAAANLVRAEIAPLESALEAGLFALNEERVRWDGDDCWDGCPEYTHRPDCVATRTARDLMQAALDRVRQP
jgi:hypothetical protein